MFILGSLFTSLLLAVTLVLAAAVAGLMAYHYAKARLRERKGFSFDPEAGVATADTGATQRAKSAEEIAQIRARIEALMEQQHIRSETQSQHLAQKLDEIRTHMNSQDNKMDGIKSELRHEIRRRDSELEDLRHQLASALDAFWKSMPALAEGPSSTDPLALPPAEPTHASDSAPMAVEAVEVVEAAEAAWPLPSAKTPGAAPHPLMPEDPSPWTLPDRPQPVAPEAEPKAPDVPVWTGASAWNTAPIGSPAPHSEPPAERPNPTPPAASGPPPATWSSPFAFPSPPADPNPDETDVEASFALPSRPTEAEPPESERLEKEPLEEPSTDATPSPDAAPAWGSILDAAAVPTGEPQFGPPPTAPTPTPPEAPAFEMTPLPPMEVPTASAPPPAPPAPPAPSAPPAPASESPATPKPVASAPPPVPAPPAAPPIKGDDLTVITEIDEAMQQKLYQAGVTSLDEMARWSRADARRISGAVGVPEEVIMHQWIFEAQSVLFEHYQQQMAG